MSIFDWADSVDEVPHARSSDPETSHEAAQGNEETRQDQVMHLLFIYAVHPEGLTAVEAGLHAGMDRPDRRVSDLKRLGYVRPVVVDDGEGLVRLLKRTPFNVSTKYGRAGMVLAITEAGERLVRAQMNLRGAA